MGGPIGAGRYQSKTFSERVKSHAFRDCHEGLRQIRPGKISDRTSKDEFGTSFGRPLHEAIGEFSFRDQPYGQQIRPGTGELKDIITSPNSVQQDVEPEPFLLGERIHRYQFRNVRPNVRPGKS